jgi:hypothetical protein
MPATITAKLALNKISGIHQTSYVLLVPLWIYGILALNNLILKGGLNM